MAAAPTHKQEAFVLNMAHTVSVVDAYESSNMELQWLTGTRKGGLCATPRTLRSRRRHKHGLITQASGACGGLAGGRQWNRRRHRPGTPTVDKRIWA